MTAENTVKHRDGGVGSVVANHCGVGESLVVVTTLLTYALWIAAENIFVRLMCALPTPFVKLKSLSSSRSTVMCICVCLCVCISV